VIRINLIPPEILQRRRDEVRWRWLWLGALIVAVALGLFYVVMFFNIVGIQAQVTNTKEQAQTLQDSARIFSVFRQRESELSARKSAVLAAATGRVDWANMLDELGLVLPTDMYLTSLAGSEAGVSQPVGSVTLAGQAVPVSDLQAPGQGYKSVAKALVRLTEMEQLDSVWLTQAGVAASTDSSQVVPSITWQISAKISPQAADTLLPAGTSDQ
jgi:type IV pilus assembly protein PilN